MNWCEIFRTGTHTDSKGNKRVWTFDDLHTIERNFRNVNSDVPICCGHPKTNSPAYGWVKELKVAGNKLYASFKDVQEEFKTAVNKGLFKTRSISLTKDLVPRHIAFLGGQSPAIKGLEQFCFESEEEDITLEFSDFGEQEIEANESDEYKNGNSEAGDNSASIPQTNHDNEDKGENVETEELKQQLGEKDKKIAELEKEIARQEQEKQTKDFQDFCDSAISEGHLLPAQRDDVMHILEACSKHEAFEFEDGNKKNPVDIVKSFVLGLGQMDFEETATKEKVVDKTESVDFSDSKSIANGIIEIQNEYKTKGIELSSAEAYKKLTEKGV
ncbi:hypothetical protein J6A64_03155 [bacterium]|nr:hypothetical protein [bacterium]MBQ2872325.1 hypothetical protein [bacterium]